TIQAPTDASLEKSLWAGAARAGATFKRATYAHVLGHPAVEVTVTTRDALGFVRNRPARLVQLVGALEDHEQPRAEGAYVEVYDTSGRLVTLSAYSART